MIYERSICCRSWHCIHTLYCQCIMTERNFSKELSYYTYTDMVYGEDIENIDYPALIDIITELCDRIEQLEKDNELLKSYAWEQ